MNPYVVLGIPVDADDRSIRNAFRSLVRRYHPDAGEGSSAEKFRTLVEAYETLSDPERRRQYDLSRRQAPVRHIVPVEPLVRPHPVAPVDAMRYARRVDWFEEIWDALEAGFFLRPPGSRW
jgi:curved DNA-binding protein CbpA